MLADHNIGRDHRAPFGLACRRPNLPIADNRNPDRYRTRCRPLGWMQFEHRHILFAVSNNLEPECVES